MSRKKKPAVGLYGVTLPITGTVYVEVMASSAEEAIDKAMEGDMPDDVDEWQFHREVCSGNTFHGSTNEASAELITDDTK